MSIYDKASLVLIPSGTKTSKVYSQKPTNGDGDFTFSRSTAATRVNASGNIEKETGNLLLQSNSFDTTWANVFTANVVGGQSGYDGSNNAWTLETQSGQASRRAQNLSGLQNVNSFSLYAKANTLDWTRLQISTASGNYVADFDLTNGVIGFTFNDPLASIESVGNGWYRVKISGFAPPTQVRIYALSGDNDPSGAGLIYIQDAQLEQGLVARDYIETTATAIYGGITDNVPRLDYTDSSCPALLLEPQRTNLVYQSEYLGGWSATNCSVTANSITSPEGVTNSFKITENSAASTQHRVILGSIGGSSAIHTMSAYVKNSSGSRMAYIDMGPVTGHFNFATETMYSAQGTANWEDAGDGWYRISITSNTAVTPVTAFAGLSVNNSETYSGDGSSAIEFYGIQIEQGSYATSYIPTYGSAVTRNEETTYVLSATDIIGQSEGTMYVEYDQNLIGQSATRRIMALTDGGIINRIVMYVSSSNKIDFYVRNSSGNLFLGTSVNVNTKGMHKIAAAYKDGDYVVYLDGTQIISGAGTAGTIPACNRIDLGNQIGVNDLFEPIYQAMLFKTRLSNEELATLTTI